MAIGELPRYVADDEYVLRAVGRKELKASQLWRAFQLREVEQSYSVIRCLIGADEAKRRAKAIKSSYGGLAKLSVGALRRMQDDVRDLRSHETFPGHADLLLQGVEHSPPHVPHEPIPRSETSMLLQDHYKRVAAAAEILPDPDPEFDGWRGAEICDHDPSDHESRILEARAGWAVRGWIAVSGWFRAILGRWRQDQRRGT